MTQSIANMSSVWMSNSNIYSAISMSVSTLGAGANADSTLLKYNVDSALVFKISGDGSVHTTTNINSDKIFTNNIFSNDVYSNTINSNIVIYTDNVVANVVRTNPLTVSVLPDPVSTGAGSRAFVTDANLNVFFGRVFSGGTNSVPVFSDGTYWRIG